jgi:hypothetical protein
LPGVSAAGVLALEYVPFAALVSRTLWLSRHSSSIAATP